MKRTLQQILADIDVRFPNVFDQDQKIEWINLTINNFYKTVAQKEIMKILTIKDQPFYFISDEANGIDQVEFELIDSVTVDNVDYLPAIEDEALRENVYFDVMGKYLGLYPTPSMDGKPIYISYFKRPKEMSSSDLTVVPQINSDYYELIKYGVIMIMAESMGDIIMFNNYAARYNALLKKAEDEKRKQFSKLPTRRDVVTKKVVRGGYRGRVASKISGGIK